MPRNWTHTLEERQEGLVEGFIGSDESFEAYEERIAAPEVADDEEPDLEADVEPAAVDYSQAGPWSPFV